MGIHLNKIFLGSILLQGCFLGQNSYAADPNIDQLIRENDRLQQIQEEQRKALQNKVLSQKKDATKLSIEQPSPQNFNENRCFEVNTILIEGFDLISDSFVEKLKEKYSNQCMYSKKISELMSEITKEYFSKGYVAARVYLPPQDIKNSRTLILKIDEGIVSELVATPRAKKTISITTAAPFLVGKPLNLRGLEQALDQFNRLQSNNVTMQIKPGEKTGESIVVFDNETSKRVSGYINYDNKGQDITGRNQAALGMNVDNIFGLNDLLSLSYNRSLPFERRKQDSEAISAFYVIPFGYHTLSLSASKSNYDTTIDVTTGPIYSSGESESYSLKVDSLLYRGAINQLRSNLGLTTKENKAYLNDILLGVSSRKLTVAELGLNYSTQMYNNYFNAYVSYQKGLDLLNALDDEKDLNQDFPKAQFDKFTYGLSYNKPFNLAEQNLMFSSNFSAQHSLNALYGSEQYSIGSLYTVRGFNQKSISGDNGFSIKNDLSLLKGYQLSNGVLAGKYYLGLDYGKVSNKYNNELMGELSSVSLGSTFNFNNVSLDLLVTQPISQPNFIKEKEADFFFSTTYTF